MQATKTIQDFIAENELTMEAVPAASNPDMPDPIPGASHWACVIAKGTHSMSVPYSQGSAHRLPPALADVLDCLALDAESIESERSFNGWCASLGFDSDSRKAEKTYRACMEQAFALRQMLDGAAYDELLHRVERM